MTEALSPPEPYLVLARKYRPDTFADLVGQDAMVRTFENAFAADRIAHAFILTGVRGVGKTTTARIIAKGLNCIGPDGTGGPTIHPCGVCEHCKSIAEGRHVDVLEMDAASRTGVNDIREIIDGVRYRAASARYKVYVIDEVHMLSTSAFNALLKTLEEPPAHVKFLFATTEIRKVPVTVLSRCQRFDLKRIEPEVLLAHLAKIAQAEGASLSDEALALIVRASEGSARDALSLLDQAIAHGQGEVGADAIRAMLGLADRTRVLDLFEAIMKGEAQAALAELGAQYSDGADPLSVLRDLAEVTHWVSLVKITPGAADDPTVNPAERERGRGLADALSLRMLTRMWQMCLKALEEVAQAPSAIMAAEMAVIRMTHVADLPTPGDLVQRLQSDPPAPPSATPPAPAPSTPAGGHVSVLQTSAARQPAPVAPPAPSDEAGPLARYASFEDVVALIRARRDLRLLVDVETHIRLAHYAPGRIEFSPTGNAPADLAQRLGRALQSWTGTRWGVSVVAESDTPTIAEARSARRDDLVGQAMRHPMVQAVLEAFPNITDADLRITEPVTEPLPEEPVEPAEDWDPLDDFD